jgi:hypothetical protein
MAPYSRVSGRKYRSALRRIVSAAPEPTSRPLPLTHVTDCIRLKSILDDGRLEPRRCAVFGEKLLYLFYARPAYRSGKIGPLHNLNYAPVCFVLDAAIADQHGPDEVFSLDTGALNNGILADDVHSDLSPYDFALEPKVNSAQRLIRLFYGDEKSYFAGRSRVDLPPHSPTDAEIVAYESLVRRGGNKMDRDERGTSVEFQFKNPLPIDGKLVGIILPQEFLDDPNILSKIKEKKISTRPYMFIPDHTVKEFVGVFYALANDIYRRKKKQYGWQW